MRKRLYVSIVILLLLSGALGTGSSEFEGYSTLEDRLEDEFEGEIEIVNNSALRDFADENDLAGNGTEKNPYLLDNYTIDGTQERYGLYLSDIDLHFTVKDTEIFNVSQAGIGAFQVFNFTLEESLLEESNIGVWLEDSSRNEILNNRFSRLRTEGIKIKGSSSNNVFQGNEFEGCGIVIEGDAYTMRGQEMSSNTVDGDPLYYFKEGISKNVTGDVGQIIIANSSASGHKDIGPMVIDSGTVGLTIAYSNSISVENVIIKGQRKQGIHMIDSEDIMVKNSTVKNNRGNGISLSHSTQIEVENTEISFNEGTGLYTFSTSNSIFRANDIRSNGKRGIDIDTPRREINIQDRPIPSENNTVYKNSIKNSEGYGIHISGYSFDNEIFLNAVTSNRLEIQDHISAEQSQGFEKVPDDALSNHWNSKDGLGNYWGEWTGVDDNRNGIIDSPYDIEGGDSKDNFPLSSTIGPPEDVRVRPRDGASKLTWNEPTYSIFGAVEEIEIHKTDEVEDNVSFYKSVEAEKRVYIDENVSNDETYYYRLRASLRDNSSVLTERIEVTPDGTPPRIIRYNPRGENVSVDSVITVEFSERMQEGSVNISIDGIPGDLRGEDKIYHFEPSENLSYRTVYHVNVTGKDLAGNLLLEEEKINWNFTTVSTLTVRGRILDEDGKPLEGVVVDTDKGTENTTDTDGRFMIKLEHGYRSIQISKPGYEEKEISLEVKEEELAHEKTIGDIELKEEESAIEASKWFLPLVTIATGMFLLGVVATVIFFLDRSDEEEIPSEEEIYEENYEDVSQEEFDSWWNDEDR